MGSMTLEDALALLDKRHAQEMAILQAKIAADHNALMAKIEADRVARETELAKLEAKQKAAEAKREAEQKAAEAKREAAEAKREAEWKAAEAKREAAEAKREAAEAKREAERKVVEAKREAEREAELKKQAAEDARTDMRIKQMERLTGSLQRDFSDLTEIILRPKMFEKINEHGHKFTITSPNKEYKDRKGNYITEVDLLLENCNEVMVIEVKSDWRVKYVGELLQKLKLLRKNQAITGMTGRTMYAAISGIKVTAKVRDLALSHGMYVMTMIEDEDRVDVVAPSKRGTW